MKYFLTVLLPSFMDKYGFKILDWEFTYLLPIIIGYLIFKYIYYTLLTKN